MMHISHVSHFSTSIFGLRFTTPKSTLKILKRPHPLRAFIMFSLKISCYNSDNQAAIISFSMKIAESGYQALASWQHLVFFGKLP